MSNRRLALLSVVTSGAVTLIVGVFGALSASGPLCVRALILLVMIGGLVTVSVLGALLVARSRAEESFFRMLIESVSEVVAVIGIDRKIQYVSPAITSALGYTEAEVMRAGTLSSIHPDDIPIAEAELKRLNVNTDVEPVPQLIRHRHKDGRWITMEGLVRKIRSANGAPVYVLTLRNVTDRVNMQLALKQSEEHLGYLANGTFEGLNIVENGRILTSNRQLAEMFGYALGELEGREVLELVASESHALVTAHAEHESVHYELLAKRKDGSTFPAEILRRRMVYYGRPVNVVAVRDITERKTAELSIRDTERRYQNLVENMRDLVMTTDESGAITSLNPAFERALGMERSGWIGVSLLELVHPDDARRARETLVSVVAGADVPLEEYRLRRSDGTFAVSEVMFAAELDGDRIKGVVAIARDITERKRLDEQLLRSQRLDGLGAIAGGIAHDLNNVLAPILLSANILKGRLAGSASAGMIESIEQCARRGSDVVKQVLTFARGSSGEHSPQQLRYVIREVQSLMRETLTNSVELVTSVASDLRPIMGDATQLLQALMNLCVNARDAMPAGGRLTVTARNVPPPSGAPVIDADAATYAGSWVLAAVSDTGQGIPEAIRDRVFDPFFTTKEAGKGTGLGLFTVARIVGDHRGVVRIESEEGKGTTVSMFFPAVVSGKIAYPQSAATITPRGNGELVLVVDDERSLLEIIRETLEAFGYRALCASNGAEALSQFVSDESVHVDAALVDLNIPVMNGAQTIKLLRRMDPRLLVVAMSGSERPTAASLEGTTGFLAKPFTGEQLLEKLHDVLSSD